MTDYGFVPPLPEHMEFVKLLVDGQADADRMNEVVIIYWRGYRCKVENKLPKLSGLDLEKRLVNALKKVSDQTTAEKKVYILLFLNT